jgi:tRNA-dependent cyclodipeptide synthase
MSKYKVIVRSTGWRSFDACTLGVSVNSPNWQDEHFASILNFAAANFKTIRIDVTDTLYRHNFMAQGLSAAEAAARAEAFGGLWLARHQALIDACPVKPDVIRWDNWHRHPDYAAIVDGFVCASRASPLLRAAIGRDVDEFFQRQGREPTELKRQHSRDYLIEELAVFTLQSRALSSLKLYPGKEPGCIHAVRKGLIAEAPPGLEREQYGRIKFHTRSPDGRSELAVSSMAPTRSSAMRSEGDVDEFFQRQSPETTLGTLRRVRAEAPGLRPLPLSSKCLV